MADDSDEKPDDDVAETSDGDSPGLTGGDPAAEVALDADADPPAPNGPAEDDEAPDDQDRITTIPRVAAPSPRPPDAIDALLAMVDDAPAALAPDPRPPLPTEPFDVPSKTSAVAADDSPFSDELDIPPPHSVPVPMPAPMPTVRPQARVVDVTPSGGPTLGGTRVTLTGEHLYRVSIVRFGGELAQTVGAREPHEIRVLAPACGSVGAVDVSVQNPSADETILRSGFTYQALPAPKIASVAPTHAAADGGSELSVIGQNFVADTAVWVGSTAAKVKFVDATTLEFVAPGGARGTLVDVAVENPDGKRDVVKRAFKYS